MRDCDRRAVEEYAVPEIILMENAGNAVYYAILKELQESGIRGRNFLIFSGTGNNGGDGFVAARKLCSMGGNVKVCITGDAGKIRGAARNNLDILIRYDAEITALITSDDTGKVDEGRADKSKTDNPVRAVSVEMIKDFIVHADVIIDGIFGTGLSRRVGGIYKTIIDLINDSKKYVVSIDIPSGINGDTGMIMGDAVNADCTVTFGLPKTGNLLYPGFGYGGKLYVSHISFPPAIYRDESLKTEVNIPSEIPPRRKDGHKGDFGNALIIAGAKNYYGAPFFSAYSFLKAGGGYARLAAPVSVTPFIAEKGPEIVFSPMEETEKGSIARGNHDILLELSEKADIVIIGPGLSLHSETVKLVRSLTEEINKPVIIDGDGLTSVAGDADILKKRKADTILTPHTGEMARLTGIPVSGITENRLEVLREFCMKYGVYAVLKGAHSLIGYPDGRIYINLSGNSGMASAGSGDVLTGTIAAAYGLGLSAGEAVKAGVFLHGAAGDTAALETGEDGLTAGDIINRLPEVLKWYREKYKTIFNDFYGRINIL
ncbi:MAG: NAD(P)H-hydrate dehydratase [Spirochaetes bacterium]|nr:NAD(P)H-hydrate dehydratase [Spirochaetota bacterium]